MGPFVHLHVHTHYSLLDGQAKIPQLVSRAKELGMDSLAVTEHGCLHSAIQFYKACRAADLNPIIGYEAYIVGDRTDKDDSNYHLTILAKNRRGYQNLLHLASHAFLDGFYRKPRIDHDLLAHYREGLIVLSGCMASEFAGLVIPEPDEAKRYIRFMRRIFRDDFYIEIMRNGQPKQTAITDATIDMAHALGVPLVATADSHYTLQSDSLAQDILLCINTGSRRSNQSRFKLDCDKYYLRSPEEMYETFSDLPESLRLTQAIADSVDLTLELGQRNFPVYAPPSGTSAEYLRSRAFEGLQARVESADDRYYARLDSELDVINELGFPDYFLMVADIVKWCNDRGILTTARGSGVGSLVCYCLHISHVDPIEHGLLFERFLDLSRRECPDIDLDVDKNRRNEINEYLHQTYGADCVAKICTFGTLGVKSSIKDVARVEGYSIEKAEQLSSLVPELPGTDFDDCFKIPEFTKAYNTDADAKHIIDMARSIEGTARSLGTHAAAYVISPTPLTNYLPLAKVTGKDEIITQYAMDDVEAVGLVKVDLLGLRNLTVLSECVDAVYQSTGQTIDIHKV